MQKLKNAVYEHRFGLLFFAVLSVFGIAFSSELRSLEVEGLTYALYAVDFSMGFCTKILPGAVANFLLGGVTEIKVSVYMKVLFLILCALTAFLLEKLYNKIAEKSLFATAVLLVFFVFYLLFERGLFGLLDFNWLILLAVFLCCLSSRKLYIFIPLIFFCTLMIHYGSIFCFIAFFALMMLYRIVMITDKKERIFLTVIFAVSVLGTAVLFIYLLLFETQNLTYNLEEFTEIMASRGATDLDYYYSGFYREAVAEHLQDFGGIDVSDVFPATNPLFVLFNTIILQIKLNLFYSDPIWQIINLVPISPLFYVGAKVLIVGERETKRKFVQFLHFCIFAVALITMMFGLLFSTDIERWFLYALFAVLIFMFYAAYNEKQYAKAFSAELSGFSTDLLVLYSFSFVAIYIV